MSASFSPPWRSVWLPRAITAIALVIGLPLFLRSSAWCDVTLYQLAARNILHGGVHYRDLFDTNMPGPVWVVTCVQAFFGTNVVALRAVDLIFVLGIVLLIDRLVKWGGATPAARAWMLAGFALFYPYASEMAQSQRDLWMALPALAALALRMRRRKSPDSTPSLGEEASRPHTLRLSFYEGVVWGVSVWVKPHIVLMAMAVWLMTTWRLAAGAQRPWRAVGADFLGNLLGGIVAAIPGVIWLIVYNAWEPFLDVFLGWNPFYTILAHSELPDRVHNELYWFPPWSIAVLVTAPLALLSVIDMAPWRARPEKDGEAGPIGRFLPAWLWDAQADSSARFVRGVFGGLYLVWITQAFLIQRGFLYVHVPETFLMFGVWATHRWAWVFVGFTWLVITSGLWIVADNAPALKSALENVEEESRDRFLPRHPITSLTRLKLWVTCWHTDLTTQEKYELWDALRLHPTHEAAITWAEIAEVATFLRSQGAGEGEIIGWHDSPHAVYLVMDIKPGFRYIHVYTAISIAHGPSISTEVGQEQVFRELAAATQAKYVISDLEWVAGVRGQTYPREILLGPARSSTNLMPAVSPCADEFPFNQPTLFRSRNGTGRYVVHKLVTRADDKRPEENKP